MGRILVVVGAVILIGGLAIHFLQGIVLFPHASAIISVAGIIVAVVGAFMARTKAPVA